MATFPTLQLPVYGLPNEVGPLFALLQDGIHAVKGALREARRDLLVVDLLSAHTPRIGDITNCYKPYFFRYHLLTQPELMISSIHQQGEIDMTTKQAREIFNQAIASTNNADAAARLEIAREYFTNPGFRKALEDHVWKINQGAA